MPSSATITTFYSFVAGGKARASEVNANFNNFRGHIVPVEINTISSSNNTHDLGASTSRWRSVYTNGIDFRSNTTTGSEITAYGDTSSSTPFLHFGVGTTASMKIGARGEVTPIVVNTTGADPGINGFSFSPGTIGVSSLNHSLTLGVYAIPGSTATATVVGRPVEFYLKTKNPGGVNPFLRVMFGTTSRNTLTSHVNIMVCRDTITSVVARHYASIEWQGAAFGFTVTVGSITGSTISSAQVIKTDFPLPGLFDISLNQTAGSYNYFLSFSSTGDVLLECQLQNWTFGVRESK